MGKETTSAGQGAVLLTVLGAVSQLLGFGYRVALARMVGAQVMGLYQLLMPMYAVVLSLTAVGLTAAVSNLTAQYLARGNSRGADQALRACLKLFLLVLLPVGGWLIFASDFVSVVLLGDARTQLGLILLVPCVALTGVENFHKHWFYGAGLVRPPAVTELCEQLVRSAAVLGLLWLFLPQYPERAVGLVVAGMVICEVFSAVTLVLGQMDLSAIAYDSGSSAILGPVAAGVVSGAVYGWVIRQNGSTGGTDIVAAWVRKKHPEASLVWLIFSLNAAVAVLSFFVYGCQFEPVILCLIYCYLSSSISDTILKGGKSAMKFEVVTRQPEELSRQLMQQLRHGVTVLQAEGMYSETPRSLLICVVNRHQVVRFQEILARFPDTFACVSSVNETWGNFKHVA